MKKWFLCQKLWRLHGHNLGIQSVLPTVIYTRWRYFSTQQYVNTKQNNIILMGSPGSGKTTVGRLLASKMGFSAIDIDNDYLESHWGVTVAEKLEEVGGDNFVTAEGDALLQFPSPNQSVIALTGSNPMNKSAMDYLRELGVVVFLDVKNSDILERLEQMKVNRIVGQTEGIAMKDILKYRQQFYEGNYDIRIVCEEGESQESIASKIQSSVNRYMGNSGYLSTRQKSQPEYKSFNDVVLEGLAPDGGLYIPQHDIPQFSLRQWERMVNLSYFQRALMVLEKWLHPTDLHPSMLSGMLAKAYNVENFDCHKIFPVVHIHDNVYANELFFGPTASFKDAALQLLPHFFSHASSHNNSSHNRYLFLVATSGDTGGAVLSGFHDLAQNSGACKVMVLYPEEGVSEVQKKQMKSVHGDGLHVVGIKSDFDFCQSSIKKVFNDPEVIKQLMDKHGFKLSAANSINWGRLLPQIVYHVSSYLDLVQQEVIGMGDPVDICIPTGNFGNILAAFYAKQMGIPFRHLICASNVNNVLTEFFNHGIYDLTHRKLHVTAAPAIDILRSSNLERYLYHVSGQNTDLVRTLYQDLNNSQKFNIPNELLCKIQKDIVADWCTEEQCKEAIQQTFNSTGYLLDPHTAVAKVVADRHNKKDCPIIIAATAHYSKFASDVIAAVNVTQKLEINNMSPEALFNELEKLKARPAMHKALKECILQPTIHKTVCEPDVKQVINQMFAFMDKPA